MSPDYSEGDGDSEWTLICPIRQVCLIFETLPKGRMILFEILNWTDRFNIQLTMCLILFGQNPNGQFALFTIC